MVPKITSVAVVAPRWSSSHAYDITVGCNLNTSPYSIARDDAVRNFTSEIVRYPSRAGTWDYQDWGVISNNPTFTNNSTSFRVEFDDSVSSDPLWQVGDYLGQVKRFERDHREENWYLKGDMLYDLRDRDANNCSYSSFTAEGDIALIGSNSISITAYTNTSSHPTLPNLASKNGNIYSRTGSWWGGYSRTFRGLIYTETGDVNFDNITGTSVYGYKVTLSEHTTLNYDSSYHGHHGHGWGHGHHWGWWRSGWGSYVGEDAFSSMPSTWQEQ